MMCEWITSLEIGRIVIGLTILFGIFYLASRSPFLGWLLKVALLAGWGVATLGAVLFVVIAIHLPKEAYGQAAGAVIVGAVLYVPWFAFGIPELRKAFRAENRTTTLWE